MSDTFRFTMTQFMRPDGRQKQIETELPCVVQDDYNAMIAAGYRLEAEVLTTDEVSITITEAKVTCDEQDVDFSVTNNGPEVITGLVEMLQRREWEQIETNKTQEIGGEYGHKNP